MFDKPVDEVAALYQMGLVYERLQQSGQGLCICYEKIKERMDKAPDKARGELLVLVVSMTKWRMGMRDWIRWKQLILKRIGNENLEVLTP
ncbi:MAG: hypothetical protein M2R45_00081 [Verrucomicrobia subdivision 3 bacterium]|nr:hypothetical protein [Limisphaerales bacterium]MCS1412461.1 hypothetical protein [Limisphaerales bacterium]